MTDQELVSFPIVWTAPPELAERTHTAAFMRRHGIERYDDLVARSIDDIEWFWDAVVGYLGIPFTEPYTQVLDTSDGIPWARWFADGRINASAVCVDRWAADDPAREAIRWEREDGMKGRLSFGELLEEVERAAGALRGLGVGEGDTVAVYLPMSPEAVVAMLAIARIGAIFVPIFSGFGADAVATRLADAAPRAFLVADGAVRRGKVVPMKETADEAIAAAGVDTAVAVVDYVGRDVPWTDGRDHRWSELVAGAERVGAVPLDAETPMLLAYTSGTTGRPKGAVHVHGGLTVKLAQEGAFQFDLRPDDVLMWLTDMGWIMGPWMVVAGLANGATIATYDGAPNHPGPERVWQLVDSLGITVLGVSPTLIRALRAMGDDQLSGADLGTLRAFGSTGEPWNPDPWWWLFDTVGRRRRPIVNISGGTEVGACFLSVNLHQGLKPTSLGGPALGMAVDVYDEEGRPVRGEVGELVCTKPWPGMTRGFWKDPDRYLATYWSRWPDVWVHGDWASIDEDGFWYLHGRSDDTMNVAGKRIGPAEVESALISHPAVVMAAAIGVPDEVKGEQIAAYVVLAPGVEPSDALAEELADLVAEHLGKAFRPKVVRFAPDLPRTRSAKIMRRVVKAKALGRPLGDLSSLENPEAVEAIEPLV